MAKHLKERFEDGLIRDVINPYTFGGIFSLIIRYPPDRNHKNSEICKRKENTHKILEWFDLVIYVHYVMILLKFSLFFYKRNEVQHIQSRNLRMDSAALRVQNLEKGPFSCGGHALFIGA